MQAALTTVVADRFAPSERGTASGFVGAGMTSGLTVGTIVAGLLAGTITFAYWLFAGAIIVVCLAFVAINREPKVEATLPPPFRASEFLTSFWVRPRQHPDFAWAFFGRFTIYMGHRGVTPYMLYNLKESNCLSLAA